MEPLLHITTRADWEAALRAAEEAAVPSDGSGFLRPASLAAEGFVHLSAPRQVLTPADALFAGRSGLVLLVLDPRRITSPIVWEDCYATGQEFPHVYGPLDLAAVVRVVDFPPGPDGRFALPADLPADLPVPLPHEDRP